MERTRHRDSRWGPRPGNLPERRRGTLDRRQIVRSAEGAHRPKEYAEQKRDLTAAGPTAVARGPSPPTFETTTPAYGCPYRPPRARRGPASRMVSTTSSSAEKFTALVQNGEMLSGPSSTGGTATARCAPRWTPPSPRDAPVLLEIDLQGARQVRDGPAPGVSKSCPGAPSWDERSADWSDAAPKAPRNSSSGWKPPNQPAAELEFDLTVINDEFVGQLTSSFPSWDDPEPPLSAPTYRPVKFETS